jgi:uncharacterized membrane protein HdeD (DUF308 family)
MELAQDRLLERPWWELVLRGLMILIMGVIALVYPEIALWAFIIVFGVIVLVEGIFQVIAGFGMKDDPRQGLLILGGLLSIGIGIVALVWPGLTAYILLLLIAAWALVMGTMQIVMATQLATESGASKWVYIIGGLIAIVFALVAISWPEATALVILWFIGFMFIFLGIQLMVLGFMAKSEGTMAEPTAGA